MAFASGELMREKVSLLKSNRGASLVLVSAFCVIIIGIAITLTVISSLLLSKAGSVKSQGQAYELATSFSSRIEELILNESAGGNKSCIDLDTFIPLGNNEGDIIPTTYGFDGIPDSSVTAHISRDASDGHYTLTVTATAARETYIKTTEYTGSASGGYTRK
ncbi:MAG: hypothetical protein J6X94_08745 [Lachnospiraceae bacterium]|nr:hypothetical protein [Lachnospiraceae bacterium]